MAAFLTSRRGFFDSHNRAIVFESFDTRQMFDIIRRE